MNGFNDCAYHFLQLVQVKMNTFNDCAHRFLQLNQCKTNKFNDCAYNFLRLLRSKWTIFQRLCTWFYVACQQSWHTILRKPHKLCLFANNAGMEPHITYLLCMCKCIHCSIGLWYGEFNEKKYSVYKSLREYYSICCFGGIF